MVLNAISSFNTQRSGLRLNGTGHDILVHFPCESYDMSGYATADTALTNVMGEPKVPTRKKAGLQKNGRVVGLLR